MFHVYSPYWVCKHAYICQFIFYVVIIFFFCLLIYCTLQICIYMYYILYSGEMYSLRTEEKMSLRLISCTSEHFIVGYSPRLNFRRKNHEYDVVFIFGNRKLSNKVCLFSRHNYTHLTFLND